MAAPVHLLAIDPGTNLGLARWSSAGAFWSGVEVLDGSTPSHKLAHARAKLFRKLTGFAGRGEPITTVFAEDFRAQGWGNGSSNAATIEFLTMLKGTILEVCAATGTDVELVASSTWRVSFLGFGKMKGANREKWKKLAVEQCARFGLDITSNDEAEAVGILHHARTKHDPRFAVMSTPLFRQVAA